MTPTEYAQWKFEHDMVLDLFSKVEAAERAILTSLRFPAVPEKVELVLREGPLPKGTTERKRQRAVHALHVLVRMREARRHLGPGRENARLAAHAALFAGLYAGDSAIVGLEQHPLRNVNGGKVRGATISAEAAKDDKLIKKYRLEWINSDELQDQYGLEPYIRLKTGFSRSKIFGRLAALGLVAPRRRRKQSK